MAEPLFALPVARSLQRDEVSELCRQLVETASDAMLVADQRGLIELANAEAERLFGYPREELIGRALEELFPERQRTAHQQERARVLSEPDQRRSCLEFQGLNRAQQEFPVEVCLSSLRFAERVWVSASIREVGERQRADQQFRALLESAPDAMVIVDLEGRIVLVNAQTEKLFGYPRAELLGHPVEVLVPARFRLPHRAHRNAYGHAPKTRSMGASLELFGVRKDGSEFPVEISLSPLKAGDTALVSSAIRDVSERKRIESAARLASDRLSSAVESIQGMLALYDADDRLVLCNSACRELLGHGIDGPLVGRTYSEIIDANLAAGLFEHGAEPAEAFRARCLGYHRNPVGTLELHTRDGQSLRVTDRRTLEGGVVSTIWDITDDVRHGEELMKARAQAEAANSAKTEFLSSMSHELRTPLNSILGFAQLLQRDKKSPLNERQLDRLDYVIKGGEHLLRLINDILDLSRIEAGQVMVSPEPVNVGEVLLEVKSTLDPMAARTEVQLIVSTPSDGSLQVVADRTRFAQILINYGSNSLKYGKPGGRAVLSVSTPSRGVVRVSVTDDGIGIPKDKQDKIFSPFHRAGQETGPIEGTGIGLAITKRLAKLMNGEVGFRSTPGEGSEFWIDLPRYEISEQAAEARAREANSASAFLSGVSGVRYTIVYIEDNPSNIAFMQDLMSELDRVRLITAPTAEVGIDLVREHRPDAVIMDINLPGMSGYEATRKLHEAPETKDIPVIALSAAAMASDRKRAISAGFYRYLTKPVHVDELMQTLEELFALPDRSG